MTNKTTSKRAHGLIIEFLSYHGYTETLKLYEKETQAILSQRPGSSYRPQTLSSSQDKSYIINQMQSYLANGQSENFLSLWEKHVSTKWRTSDRETIRVEFFTRLFLATHSIRKINRDVTTNIRETNTSYRSRVVEFRDYLDRKGHLLADYPDLLPFYALPYVSDPSTHPSFTSIFEDEWSNDLFVNLKRLLQKSFEQSETEPEIYSLIDPKLGTVSNSHSSAQHQDKFEQTKREYANYVNAMHERYEELFLLSSDLLRALGGAIKGKRLNIEFLKCAKQKLDSLKLDRCMPGTPRVSLSPIHKEESIYPENQQAVTYVTLDYTTLKKDFQAKSNIASMPYILQALRWRLSKAPSKDRKNTLATYIHNDLLGFRDWKPSATLGSLLLCNDYLVVEETLRLIYTMAHDNLGITYLLSDLENNTLLFYLVSILKQEESDTGIRQIIVRLLQQFAITARVLPKLMSLGLMDILCDILSSGASSCSPLTAEYSSALLMDMCNVRGAIELCQKNNILKVCSDLLEHENPQVRTYVNGVLYSILRVSSVLKEKAREMGLEELLHMVMNNSEETLANQIRFILQLFDMETVEPSYSDQTRSNEDLVDEGEEEDEQEYLEEEEEVLTIKPNQVIGEELLCSLYLANNETAQQEFNRLSPVEQKPRNLASRDLDDSRKRISTARLKNGGRLLLGKPIYDEEEEEESELDE